MTDTERTDIATALADVRRAYRLLWAYQRHILNYNQFIRERLRFEHYYTHYQMSHPSNPELTWAWDLLQFVLIGFESVRRTTDDMSYPNGEWWNYPKANDALLYVLVESDTGFRDAYNRGKAEPNPTVFPDVLTTKSRLHLYLLLNRQDRLERLNWHEIVKAVGGKWPKPALVAAHPTVVGVNIYGEIFDLAALGDEKAVFKAVDNFAELAKTHLGIDLSL